jgi:hypothetical protein
MPDKLGADHWAAKAVEARAQGEAMTNETAKEIMLEISARYERLVVEANRRERMLQGG